MLPAHFHEQIIYWTNTYLSFLHRRDNRSWYVVGCAKSGTNWICNLLSDYFNIPVNEPWNYTLPRSGPFIFHLHRFLPGTLGAMRVLYVLRDGRDVCVSRYFDIVRTGGPEKRYVERRIGMELKEENITRNLPTFIDFLSSYHRGSLDWKSHVAKSYQREYTLVKYENMLEDPVTTLTNALIAIMREDPNTEKVMAAVEKNSFAKITNRTPGTHEPGNFMRKGISGDWKNHFSPEARRVFAKYAGDELIKSGYETDYSWAYTD